MRKIEIVLLERYLDVEEVWTAEQKAEIREAILGGDAREYDYFRQWIDEEIGNEWIEYTDEEYTDEDIEDVKEILTKMLENGKEVDIQEAVWIVSGAQ